MSTPKELHDLHNDYPLASEILKVNKVEKLIPNLYNKSNYIIHHESLKLYEKLGLRLQRFIVVLNLLSLIGLNLIS